MRGRRFVRPALILAANGDERRVLAELDEKPWAAQDGEPWRATFLIEDALDGATRLELSVAPDINVPLGNGPTNGRGGDEQPIRAQGRPPTPAAAAPATRAPARAPDGERLATRLTTAEAALERERERRSESEESRERQLSEVRRLGAELARVRAELELAHAAERESEHTAALLDASRSETHALRARHEALTAEHEQLLRVQVTLQDENARTRHSRDQLAQELRARSSAPEPIASHAAPVAHATPPSHAGRPLNPSLRSRSWLLRLLVALVFAGVLLALYLVLHSTVLH